jgi:hypothetical protein
MDPGKGYIARSLSAGDFTTSFTGIPNNGLITQSVFKSNGGQGLARKHWNLVGNPYPSALSAEKFLVHPANDGLEGVLYIWNQGEVLSNVPNPGDSPYYQGFKYNYTDSYFSTNASGAVPSGFEGNIGSGQAFFVKVLDQDTPDESTIEFRNTMRFDGASQVLDNTQFFRTNTGSANASIEKERIWLTIVSDNNTSSSTLIGYIDGATFGKDRLFDAYPRSASGLSLYSFIDQYRMVIQGRPLPFDELDVVPLGTYIPNTGVYTIAIDKLDGIVVVNNDTSIILEDTYTGVFHDLKEAPYRFNAQKGAYNDRFMLRFDANQLSTNEVEIADTFVFVKNKRLTVSSEVVINGIQVYDITGKEILKVQPQNNLTKVELDFNFAKGAYIAVITLEGNIKTSVKLIN